MSLRVLLADDQIVTLEGTRLALEAADGISVVGQASGAAEALSMVARTRPDIVLAETQLGGLELDSFVDKVRLHHADAQVVIFSMSSQLDDVQAALEAGAAAYIVKTIHPLDLASALRLTVERMVFRAELPQSRQRANGDAGDLTPRELDILAAVARGLTNKGVAGELWITEQTVKFHLTNIYRKLGVPCRTAAVRYAHENGLVELAEQRAVAS